MVIRVLRKDLLKDILKKKKPNLNSLYDDLYTYNGQVLGLESTYEHSSLKYNLGEDRITQSLLTGIISLILNNRLKRDTDKFEYELEDLQKVFEHLNKDDLKLLGDTKREAYTKYIEECAKIHTEFTGVFINEHWEIDGGDVKDVSEYRNRVYLGEGENVRDEEGADENVLPTKETKGFRKWFSKYRLALAYLFGFLFVIPLLVIPIAAVGIYRTQTLIKNPKKRRRRMRVYITMLVLTGLWLIITTYIFIEEMNNGTFLGPKQSFDTYVLGAGMVTINNGKVDGDGRVIGLKNYTIGDPGDTITVSVLVTNVTTSPIENVKVELFPRNSGFNKKHSFNGAITGFGVRTISGTSFVATHGHTRLRSLDDVYIQHNNGQSDFKYPNDFEKFSLFNGGFSVGTVYPGFENGLIINTKYIIEKEIDPFHIFHPDPKGNGLGTTTVGIKDTIGMTDNADVLHVKIPDKGQHQTFDVYLDYQNISRTTLTDARVKIDFASTGESERCIITGILKTNKHLITQSDEAYIDNLPSSWRLELMGVYAMNTRGEDCGSHYEYTKKLNRFLVTGRGATLPILDNKGTNPTNDYPGFCSQGYIVATFKITNTEEY